MISTQPQRERFINQLGYETIPPPINENYSSWIYKADNYAEEMKYQDHLDKPNQQILKSDKKGKAFLLENYFKPECCPSSYSNSHGCSCLTHEQLQYLSARGGNKAKA